MACPTAILSQLWTPVPQRRGAPRGCPEVGHADGEGRHEACPYVVIELRKV